MTRLLFIVAALAASLSAIIHAHNGHALAVTGALIILASALLGATSKP